MELIEPTFTNIRIILMICNFRALSGIRLQELCLIARHSPQQTWDKSDIHSPTKVGYGGTDISEPIVPVCSIAQNFHTHK